MWLLNRAGASRLAHLVSMAMLVPVLLLALQALARPAVRTPNPPTIRSQPAPAPVVRVMPPSMTILVVVTVPGETARETSSVTLVGPDGQKRNFPSRTASPRSSIDEWSGAPARRWSSTSRLRSSGPLLPAWSINPRSPEKGAQNRSFRSEASG
jgi:hypothetical protein